MSPPSTPRRAPLWLSSVREGTAYDEAQPGPQNAVMPFSSNSYPSPESQDGRLPSGSREYRCLSQFSEPTASPLSSKFANRSFSNAQQTSLTVSSAESLVQQPRLTIQQDSLLNFRGQNEFAIPRGRKRRAGHVSVRVKRHSTRVTAEWVDNHRGPFTPLENNMLSIQKKTHVGPPTSIQASQHLRTDRNSKSERRMRKEITRKHRGRREDNMISESKRSHGDDPHHSSHGDGLHAGTDKHFRRTLQFRHSKASRADRSLTHLDSGRYSQCPSAHHTHSSRGNRDRDIHEGEVQLNARGQLRRKAQALSSISEQDQMDVRCPTTPPSTGLEITPCISTETPDLVVASAELSATAAEAERVVSSAAGADERPTKRTKLSGKETSASVLTGEVATPLRVRSFIELCALDVRMRIFRHVLVSSKPIQVTNQWRKPIRRRGQDSAPAHTTAILRVCRQFALEGTSVLYGENCFSYLLRDARGAWFRSRRGRVAGEKEIDLEKYGHLMRHAQIQLQANRTGEIYKKAVTNALLRLGYVGSGSTIRLATLTLSVEPRLEKGTKPEDDSSEDGAEEPLSDMGEEATDEDSDDDDSHDGEVEPPTNDGHAQHANMTGGDGDDEDDEDGDETYITVLDFFARESSVLHALQQVRFNSLRIVLDISGVVHSPEEPETSAGRGSHRNRMKGAVANTLETTLDMRYLPLLPFSRQCSSSPVSPGNSPDSRPHRRTLRRTRGKDGNEEDSFDERRLADMGFNEMEENLRNAQSKGRTGQQQQERLARNGCGGVRLTQPWTLQPAGIVMAQRRERQVELASRSLRTLRRRIELACLETERSITLGLWERSEAAAVRQ